MKIEEAKVLYIKSTCGEYEFKLEERNNYFYYHLHECRTQRKISLGKNMIKEQVIEAAKAWFTYHELTCGYCKTEKALIPGE